MSPRLVGGSGSLAAAAVENRCSYMAALKGRIAANLRFVRKAQRREQQQRRASSSAQQALPRRALAQPGRRSRLHLADTAQVRVAASRALHTDFEMADRVAACDVRSLASRTHIFPMLRRILELVCAHIRGAIQTPAHRCIRAGRTRRVPVDTPHSSRDRNLEDTRHTHTLADSHGRHRQVVRDREPNVHSDSSCSRRNGYGDMAPTLLCLLSVPSRCGSS